MDETNKTPLCVCVCFFFSGVGVGKQTTMKLTDGVKVGNSSKTQQRRTHKIPLGKQLDSPYIMCHLISPRANGGFEMIYMDVLCTFSLLFRILQHGGLNELKHRSLLHPDHR